MSSLTSHHLAEKERASFFSVLTSGSAIGTLFTGTFGSYLLDYYGWPAVFYVIGMSVMYADIPEKVFKLYFSKSTHSCAHSVCLLLSFIILCWIIC
jgi:MFS family permease